ncbi:MAG: AraC family transcriptional regulator [Lentisphaeria bacterium]|nr:AraC family transcriptional regulator [Lentisphaeria bacterium]
MNPQKTYTLLPPGRPFRYSSLYFPPGDGIKVMEFHGTSHFGVIFSGDQKFNLVGGSRILMPGDLYLIAPWEIHFQWSSSRSGCRQLELDFNADEVLHSMLDMRDTFQTLLHLTSATRHQLLNAPAAREIGDIYARKLLAMLDEKREFATVKQWLTIVEMFAEIVSVIDKRNFPKEELRKYDRIRPALEKLSMRKYLSLKDAAQACSLSPSRFSHLFSEVCAIPYNHYERNFRLNLAAMDMLGRKLNVAEAAIEWGFSSPSHFIRLFKKTFGQTPGNYLKSYSGY